MSHVFPFFTKDKLKSTPTSGFKSFAKTKIQIYSIYIGLSFEKEVD